MSNDATDTRDGQPSRRDFLSTSAKVGAGVALAGAGVELASPRIEVRAAGTVLNYIGILDQLQPQGPVDQIAAFERQNPGVKVNWIKSPQTGGADAYHDKLVTLFSSQDSGIDVADSDVIWQAQWAPAGWVVPLDDLMPPTLRAQYAPGMIFADTINSHLYAIPFYNDVGHLFYRKDILDANGLEPAKTWQELAAQCVRLRAKYPKMIGFVASYQKGQQLICNFLEYTWSNGGDVLDAKNNVIINSAQNIEALQIMVDYVNKHKITQPGIVSMELDTGRQLFTNGHAIYHRNWGYAYATSQASPAVRGKVGVTYLPTFPGGASHSCQGGWQYVVNKYGKNVELAKKFVLFMGGPAGATDRTLHGSFPPAYLPADYDKAVVAKYPAYPIIVKQATTAKSRPKTPLYTQLSQATEAELTNAIVGSKSAKKALDDAAAQIQSVLSNQ